MPGADLVSCEGGANFSSNSNNNSLSQLDHGLGISKKYISKKSSTLKLYRHDVYKKHTLRQLSYQFEQGKNYKKTIVYSLRNVYTPLFENKSFTWWAYLISTCMRCMCGSVISILGVIFAQAPGEYSARVGFSSYKSFAGIMTCIFGIVILGTGLIGARFLYRVSNNSKASQIPHVSSSLEHIAVRVALGASLIIVALNSQACILFSSIQPRAHLLILIVVVGLSVVLAISAGLICLFWLERIFLVYTVLSFLRWWNGLGVGCILLSFAMKLKEYSDVTHGHSGIKDAAYIYMIQRIFSTKVLCLGEVMLFTGFGGLLGIYAGYQRSAVLIGADCLISVAHIICQYSICISFRFVSDTTNFLVEKTNNGFISFTAWCFTEFLFYLVLSMLITHISAVLTFVMILPSYIPMTWKVSVENQGM